MSASQWSKQELAILRTAPGAAVAYRRLFAAGFPRTMAAVKAKWRQRND